MSVLSVFVSSRMQELSAERALLYELIPKLDLGGYQLRPWVFEAADGAPASSRPIRDVYLDALQRAVLYIGIIGDEYGEWTIDEFSHATRWGIERHLYIKGAPGGARDARLQAFLGRWTDVESGLTARFFRTPEELSEAVTHGLEAWSMEQVVPRPPSVTAQILEAPEQVPDRAARLLGRDALVQLISEKLETAGPTLICGFAGAGKSAVASAVCQRWLARGGQSAVWMRCGFARAEELVAAIARSFGRAYTPHTFSIEEHLQLLRSCLEQLPGALVVFDDCWNGEALFSVLSAIPQQSPVLATARQRYPLETIYEAGALAPEAAMELLSTSAGKDYRADRDASRLCEELSNHAFSVEIAGRALKVQNRRPGELLHQIGTAPHELTTPLGFGERSRRSVKTLLNASLDALDADQQLAFLAFGAFFAPTLTAEMIHQFRDSMIIWGDDKLSFPAVASRQASSFDDTLALLRDLEAHNLAKRIFVAESPMSLLSVSSASSTPVVQKDTGRPPDIEVYRVHDLAYSFARSRGSDDNRKRALDITLCFTFFYNATAQKIFDIVRPELDNFMGAAAWAISSGQPLYAERLAENLAHSGRFLQAQGLYQHALTLLDLAARSAKSRGDSHAVIRHTVERANVLLRLDRREEAKEIYQLGVEQARRSGDQTVERVLLTNLGSIYMQSEIGTAREFTQQALSLARRMNDGESEADILSNLGSIATAQGHYEEAATLLADAAQRHESQKKNSSLAIDLTHLGRLRQIVGDWKTAAGHYGRAVELLEGSGDLQKIAASRYGLGLSQLNLGETKPALKAFAEAREDFDALGDQNMVAHCDERLRAAIWLDRDAAYDLACRMSAAGKHADAEEAFRRALELGNAIAANHLGAFLMNRGETQEAWAVFRRGMELGDGDAAANVGQMYKARGEFDNAEAAYRTGIERGSSEAAFLLGSLLEDRNRFAEAERAFRTGMERGSGNAAGELGSMLYRQNRLAEAEQAFRTGLARGNGIAAYNLGVLLSKMGRSEEGEAVYRRAIELGNGDAASNLGAVLLDKGLEDEGEKALSQGASLGSGPAATNLGAFYYMRGLAMEAEMAWRRGIELRHAISARYLGAILQEQGRLGEAETAFRAGIELGDGECSTQLAVLLEKSKRPRHD